MSVFLGSLLNVLTLIMGLGIGFFVGTSYSKSVHAQTAGTQPQVQEITPVLTTGSIGSALILAHEIQSDHLVVNGYDIMKLHQETLNYLSHQLGANVPELNAIVANSRADKLYTVKPPSAPKPSGGKQ